MKYFLGFDISTTTIGISIYNENFQLHSIEHLTIQNIDSADYSDENKYIYKALSFEKKLIELKEQYEILDIFVESALKNANAKTSIDTIIMLSKMNGMSCLLMYKIFGIEPKMITVYEARKIFCPEFVTKTILKEIHNDLHSFVKKHKNKLPKSISMMYKKYNKNTEYYKVALDFLFKKFNLKYEGEFYEEVLKETFSYPKELDIKTYLLDKLIKKYPFIEQTLEYNRNNKLKKENLDRSDACIVVESGLYKYKYR